MPSRRSSPAVWTSPSPGRTFRAKAGAVAGSGGLWGRCRLRLPDISEASQPLELLRGKCRSGARREPRGQRLMVLPRVFEKPRVLLHQIRALFVDRVDADRIDPQ